MKNKIIDDSKNISRRNFLKTSVALGGLSTIAIFSGESFVTSTASGLTGSGFKTKEQFDTIIANGLVYCGDGKAPLKADLGLKNGKISAIGKLGKSCREFIDAKGGVIMPAFINTHEHIYSSFARGLAINGYNPTGLLSILEGMWWTLDRNLTLNDTYLSAMATYIDSIKNGVTTVFDHHASFGAIKGSLFEIERAAKETGIRSCLCYEVSDRDGKDKARESVMENAEFIRHALKDDSGMIA